MVEVFFEALILEDGLVCEFKRVLEFFFLEDSMAQSDLTDEAVALIHTFLYDLL